MTTALAQARSGRFAVLILSLTLGARAASAAEVTPPAATVAIETWVRQVTADARPDAVIESLEPYEQDGVTYAYVAHLDGGGFCICGADDRLLPVYLYNPAARFDPTNPGYQYILRSIARRLQKFDEATLTNDPILDEYAPGLIERSEQWWQLSTGIAPPAFVSVDRSVPTQMALPLDCRWKQGSPFNDFCPELTPGVDEHMIVGCVATAMAQIMYYWKWPESGDASNTTPFYYRYANPPNTWLIEPLAVDPNIPASGAWMSRLHWSPDNGGQLEMSGWWENSIYDEARDISEDSAYRNALADLYDRLDTGWQLYTADFSAATYDWSSMPAVGVEPPDAGTLEAAEISYHAALSVDMDFGLFASSANQSNFPYYTFFRYDPDARSNTRFDSYVVEDIRWLRVVQVRGQNDIGGHSWVIAGYNNSVSPPQYLMNLGWGGGTTEWATFDDYFEDEQHILTRIAPESVVRFVTTGGSGGDGTPSDPYPNLGTAVNNAPDDTTLIMYAGSTHTLHGTDALLDRPMTLRGYDVMIERGAW